MLIKSIILFETVPKKDLNATIDSIPHTLVEKLYKYILEIEDPLLSWVSSSLSNRNYHARVGSSLSWEIRRSPCVPQGSDLSPLLFIRFLNYCTNVFPPQTISNCFVPYPWPTTNVLSRIISTLLTLWCTSNGLELCTQKCFSKSFGQPNARRIHTTCSLDNSGQCNRHAKIRWYQKISSLASQLELLIETLVPRCHPIQFVAGC